MSEETVLKLRQGLDENKVEGLDNLSGKFLKDGATFLAKPIFKFVTYLQNIQYFRSTVQ